MQRQRGDGGGYKKAQKLTLSPLPPLLSFFLSLSLSLCLHSARVLEQLSLTSIAGGRRRRQFPQKNRAKKPCLPSILEGKGEAIKGSLLLQDEISNVEKVVPPLWFRSDTHTKGPERNREKGKFGFIVGVFWGEINRIFLRVKGSSLSLSLSKSQLLKGNFVLTKKMKLKRQRMYLAQVAPQSATILAVGSAVSSVGFDAPTSSAFSKGHRAWISCKERENLP